MTPFDAARINCGSAAFNAAVAAALSPEASASSTLRTNVRARLMRLRLISVNRTILRAAFLAELVLAVPYPETPNGGGAAAWKLAVLIVVRTETVNRARPSGRGAGARASR